MTWVLALVAASHPYAAHVLGDNSVAILYDRQTGCELVLDAPNAEPLHAFESSCWRGGIIHDAKGRIFAWTAEHAILVAAGEVVWRRTFDPFSGVVAAVATSKGIYAAASQGTRILHFRPDARSPNERPGDERATAWVGVSNDMLVVLGRGHLYRFDGEDLIATRRVPPSASQLLSRYEPIPSLDSIVVQPCDIVGRLGSRCEPPYILTISGAERPRPVAPDAEMLTLAVGTALIFAREQGGEIRAIDVRAPDEPLCLGILPPDRYVYAAGDRELVAVGTQKLLRLPVQPESRRARCAP
ncbi:MAG: hypothetical protein AAFX94_01595 [Myxococcota bacterium]